MLFVSALLLTLHNITPHLHHEELSEPHAGAQQDTPESILDWIVSSFHLDFGEGHLECFSQSDTLDFCSDFQWVSFDIIPGLFSFQPLMNTRPKTTEEILISRLDIPPTLTAFKHALLRAPPRRTFS